ncbi:Breast cancer anti-estrogen resistance protein 1 [Fasciola hepatica]|uniref:Breast cancer anti-estrogen resistance protein 1 n=1 Tax=Fasciola hepatica TaxID=6192 RepID=A0A4E0RFU4_FASHE|nr:Breast cancer anti-estrogen resistance protein 1 [Fasciola hepatica]
MTTKPIKTLLARALYDNQSEFPTELAFSRGDVVTVLQRDPEGYEGWWICSLKGKIGIAPGNRFEILGSISKTKPDEASDVYDDPREWAAPEPVKRLHQAIPCVQEPGMGTYENLDSNKSGNRISDVTDSGNYSNRSSDVSLSSQSVTGATLTASVESRLQPKTPDSQFEDYEDLDLGSPRNCKPDLDMSARALPPMPHCSVNSARRQNPMSSRRLYNTNDYKRGHWQNDAERLDPIISCPAFSDSSRKSTGIINAIQASPEPNKNSTWENDHPILTKNSFLNPSATESASRIEVLKDQQNIITALRSRSTYLRFFSPLKQRIEAQSKRVLSSIRSDQPQNSMDITVCVYNLALLVHDLSIIHQICDLLTASTKDSPDAGLTRKFLLIRKTADDVKNQLSEFIRFLEEKKLVKFTELPHTLQLVLQTVSSLDAAVLANAPLLFSPAKVLRRANSGSRSHASSRPLEASRTLSSSVPHLNHLGTAEIRSSLEQMRRLTPEQFKAFQSGICPLKRQCDASLNIVQGFLEELKAHDWSPTGHRQQKTPLTLSFLTSQVKNILHQSSLLVRAITEFCATLCGDGENSMLENKQDCRRKLAMELEQRGSAICETLKGLVIQAKEATNHLRSEDMIRMNPCVTNSVLPMPGPIWQRLLGSTRSVCMSLTAVNEILASYSVAFNK